MLRHVAGHLPTFGRIIVSSNWRRRELRIVRHDVGLENRIFQVNPEVQDTVKSGEKNDDYTTLPVYEASTIGHGGSAGNTLDSCAREGLGRNTVYPDRFPRYFPLLPDKCWNGIYRVIRNDCPGFNNLSYTIHLR